MITIYDKIDLYAFPDGDFAAAALFTPEARQEAGVPGTLSRPHKEPYTALAEVASRAAQIQKGARRMGYRDGGHIR